MKTLAEYTSEMEAVISGLRNVFFPMEAPLRKQANLKLGRELGYGLAQFEGYKNYVQASYGRVIVKNSLDTTGVVISSKEWRTAINEGIKEYQVNSMRE